MEFRFYQTGDEEGICALLSLVFTEERQIEWWHWYYQAGPAGPALIRLAMEKGRVVGHRALIPYHIWNGSGYAIACQASDAAVHPDYRGRGIFGRLTEEVLAAAQERGWAFVFSFPNEKSLPLNRRLGWQPRQKLRKWVKPLPGFFPTRYKGEPIALRGDSQRGREFDHLWELYGRTKAAGICKDGRYLEWRYLKSSRKKNYTLLVWEEEGEIQAYSVVAREGGKGHLLEFMPGPLNPPSLLRGVEAYLRRQGARFLTMWPPPELARAPWRQGYIPNPLRLGTLALRPLAGEVPPLWRLTAGDTDYA